MSFEIDNQADDSKEPAYKSRPQHLCKTCGRCCRAITTSYTHDELKKFAEEGDDEARVFVEIFKQYPSVEEARKVVPEHIDQVLATLKQSKVVDVDKVTFYYCPHISENNLCGIYETRPECCRRAPRHGWSLMPPGCGFEGWQFEQREKHKKTIRKLKEHLYLMETLYGEDGMIPDKGITVREFKESIEKRIRAWERFGSMHW